MNEKVKQLSETIEEMVSRLHSSEDKNQNEVKLDFLRNSLALLYNERGFVYYKLVEFNLAADDYSKAIQLDPNLAVAYYNRGTIHYRMDDFDKALDDMKVAVTLDPNNQEFGLAFQQSYEQLNKS